MAKDVSIINCKGVDMKKYVSTVLKMEVENPDDYFIVYGFGEIVYLAHKNLCKFDYGLFYNEEN